MLEKVVHISTVHSPHDPRIYHKQCRTLARAGYDVTLVIPRDGDFSPQGGVKTIMLPRPKNRWVRLLRTCRLAYRAAKDLDARIYHFHDPELIPFAHMLKNKDNIVIYDIHEDYETAMAHKEYMPKPLNPAAAMAYRNGTRLLIKKFELCLAEKYYVDKFPWGKCILNYPHLSMPAHVPREEEPKDLLYVGNVTPARGAFIHASLPGLDPRVTVHYLGRCSKKIADQINKENQGQQERIKITGVDRYVPWEQIHAACFQPNWLAGLALFPPSGHYEKKELTKFFEYMAAEIPILCSNFPQWKEFVEQYDCGIAVNPEDNQEIARALNYLMNNPQRASEMGCNGRRAVEAGLNWESQGEQLVAWYSELLGRTDQ